MFGISLFLLWARFLPYLNTAFQNPAFPGNLQFEDIATFENEYLSYPDNLWVLDLFFIIFRSQFIV